MIIISTTSKTKPLENCVLVQNTNTFSINPSIKCKNKLSSSTCLWYNHHARHHFDFSSLPNKIFCRMTQVFSPSQKTHSIFSCSNLFSFIHSFLTRCYTLFGETMDLLALINAAIGFVLYGSMSKQFRVTFKSLFFRRQVQKIEMTRVTNINNTTTNVWLTFLRNIFRWNASKL